MQQADAAPTRDEAVFRDMPVHKAVITMALPTVVGQLIVLFYNLADTFFIGRTGNPYMVAAASLILPVFNISNAVSDVVGLGGGTLVSRLLGADNRDEAEKVSAFTFSAAGIGAACWSVLVLLCMNPMLKLLGASSETFAFARTYAFCVVVLGGVPTILQLTCAQLLRAVGYSRQAGFGISMGGILNVILDPLFMFVILPKGNEILGAGIATMLSNVVTLVFFLITIRRIQKSTVLSLSLRRGMPCRTSIRSVFVNGTPGGISNLLFNFSQVTINRLMSGYGDIPLAGIGIVLKAERIPLNTGVGICQGIIPIVAYNYAAGNHDRMNDTIRFSRRLGLGVAAVSIMMYELFAGPIMGMFIPEAETVRIGAGFLRARCLATPFMFMAFHILFSIQAMGEGKVAMALAVIRQLILYIPLLFIMNALFGMYGLVWAQLIGDAVTDIISYLWFFRILKKDKYDNLG